MYQCTNVLMYQCTNVQMYQCTNVPTYQCRMYKCTNVLMYQCTNILMYNVPMHQYTNVPMYQCTNVLMYQCTNVSMYQCTNVILGNWSSKVSWLTPALTLPPLQFTAHFKPIVPAQVQYRNQCNHTWRHHWCAAALTLPPASSCTTSTLSAVYQQTGAVYHRCSVPPVLQQCTTSAVQCTTHTCAHPALDPLPTIRLLRTTSSISIVMNLVAKSDRSNGVMPTGCFQASKSNPKWRDED